MSEIIIYQTPGKEIELDVKLEEDTVWLTQKQIATLFDKSRVTITGHISNVFKEKELEEHSVCRNFRQVRRETR